VNVGERILAALRGSINPLILRATQNPHRDVGRTLIICGFPRSGTTWLTEVLSGIPGTGIVFEPLDVRHVQAAKRAGFDWENFIPPDTDWPAGEGYIREVLAGRVWTKWTCSQLPLSRARQVDRWIVKFVRANQMLGWIVSHFDVLPPILLVRHPCAVYDSWIRRGWPVHQKRPPETLRFFQTYPDMARVVADLESPEEFFAADWAMQHYTPLHQLDAGAFQLRFYERLRAHGLSEITQICDRWNVPVPMGLDRSLGRPSAKASGQARRPRGEEPGWSRRLDESVVHRILNVVGRFGLNLYARDGLPESKHLHAPD
jgi:hypothetical protein